MAVMTILRDPVHGVSKSPDGKRYTYQFADQQSGTIFVIEVGREQALDFKEMVNEIISMVDIATEMPKGAA